MTPLYQACTQMNHFFSDVKSVDFFMSTLTDGLRPALVPDIIITRKLSDFNMRRFIKYLTLFLLILTSSSACNGQDQYFVSTSFHEPANEGLRYIYSKDGIHWNNVPGIWLKPEVGEQKVMRDPSMVCSPDGVFHMVWTSSWKGDKGFGYASSKDLIHWTNQRLIPVMADEPATVNVWAPEIFRDEDNDRYIIVWSSTIPFRFPKGEEDEYNNHRLYYTITKDFKEFSKAKLFFDPGYSVIDAVILKRTDHDFVLVFKDNTRPNRNLKAAFGKTALGPWKNLTAPFTENFVEGPTVLKTGTDYLIMYDVYRKMIYGASSTKDFKSFKSKTSHINVPVGHKHGTVFKAPVSVIMNLLQTAEATQN